MSLISIKKLDVGYEDKKVIKKMSIDIEEGDFITIVGSNGSGKSSLIKTILGLIKPLSGSIELTNIKRSFIGYMPQETKVDKNFPASVYEIVLSGCLNRSGFRPFYSKDEKEMVLKNMKLLKIDDLKNKSFCDLSGGQRQRVLLARSLCASTKLLILDEPSNNLDFKSNKEFLEIVGKLNSDGMTILMVTHDLDHVNIIGNKVLALDGVGGYFYGSNEEYMEVVHE